MNKYITEYIDYHPVRTQRGLEILSGLIPWFIILFPFVGSFFIPNIIAYAIIAFNIYWLYRSSQTAINATVGYLNLKATGKIDWVYKLKTDPLTKTKFQKIINVVMIANVKEPLEILDRNVHSISKQNFPLKNIIVVLAMEERAKEIDEPKAKKLLRKYKNVFRDIIVTYHPLVGVETIGKHSNNAYAAKYIKNLLVDEFKTPIKNILMTTCDSDTVWPNQYFSLLTYKFLTSQKPYNSFFQAPLFMYNNLHRIPFLVRVPAIMGGIGYLAMLQKASGRVMNYSAYSESLFMLDEVGYWDLDVIPEDWHINLKSYFYLHGDLTVTPLWLPIHIDAAESTNRWKTYKNTYEQGKRWAWGVVDIPYVVKNFIKHTEIPLSEKLKKLSLALEWHFSWSSAWFLITLGATIPTILNPVFARTTLGYNLPRLSSFILTLCLIGILVIIVIDILLDPHKKNKFLALIHPLTYLQWLFLPVFGLLFGSLPGLESQTRLMFGKYLGYRVTEKKV